MKEAADLTITGTALALICYTATALYRTLTWRPHHGRHRAPRRTP